MWENIAMWGGVAGVVVAVFAVIILYLTRSNILDILQKDVILFDKNFEMKKEAITSALSLIDEIEERGQEVTLRPEFIEKAKTCYNDLICVVSDMKLAEEFYDITLDKDQNINSVRLAHFKLLCRQDIGLKTKHAKLVKRATNKKDSVGANETILRTSMATNNISNLSASTDAFASVPRPQPQAPARPMPSAQPTRPTQPVRPTQTIASQSAQPMRRPTSPNSENK
ncbi:MAG: hypothetical protein E7351_00025 [Clostridiales bacterium]|nr:hypothetical protein [Clostridiales bacterium]